jgi:DNA (cytosine-5)-methyltransferase 3A
MKVLSLFDGMSCGQIALRESEIPVDVYHASEIDKYAIAQTALNFPETIQFGDVTRWREWDIPRSLTGGSPCQGFSVAGKGLNFKDPRSRLFFTFVEIRDHLLSVNPNVRWMLENVNMKQEWIGRISNLKMKYLKSTSPHPSRVFSSPKHPGVVQVGM